MTAKQARKSLCQQCGARCCRYVATQVDTPTCKRDYDHIRWYLAHRNVGVFIDHEHDWYIEFETPCDALQDDKLCANYSDRPLICRDHGDGGEGCEFTDETPPYHRRFDTPSEFEEYLASRGIDWRWKRLK